MGLKEAIFANNKHVKHSVRQELEPLPDFGRKKQPWGVRGNLVLIAVLKHGEVCPMPNAQCPMPNALCPMPYAR